MFAYLKVSPVQIFQSHFGTQVIANVVELTIIYQHSNVAIQQFYEHVN